MPGPTTEILNDDIKELKVDIRDIRGDLAVIKTDLHHVATGLAELRGEVRVISGFAKWAGTALVTTMLTSGIAGIWWASGINTKVEGLGARMEEKSKETDEKIDRLEAKIDRMLDQGRSILPIPKPEVGAGPTAK